MTRPWFLGKRITVAFGLTTFLLSLAISVPFGWIVHTTIQEEIQALAREELEETRAYFADGTPSLAAFADAARTMSLTHPENRLAWRIWNEAGERWTEFGPPELLALVPRGRPTQWEVQAPAEHLRLASDALDGGMAAAVMLDVTALNMRFRQYLLVVPGLVLLATCLATLAGHLVGRRVSRLLATVAECARTEDAVDRWPSPHAAPQEIQAVVGALQDTLRTIREETKNAQLLISGMAHELRSPLQNLMGETQVALLREREPDEYQRVLESHLEDLGQLSRVVDNLVTLSSVEEARRRRTAEYFDLSEETRLRLARERQLARRRGIELQVLADGALPIEGDRESLLLALRNVITNAIEWSPQGGRVEVHMTAGAGGVEVTVDDAGPGVPPAERELIFRPFHRGRQADGRRVGFGLGLALTHSVVHARGGSVDVADSPLGGARFRIVLPAHGRG